MYKLSRDFRCLFFLSSVKGLRTLTMSKIYIFFIYLRHRNVFEMQYEFSDSEYRLVFLSFIPTSFIDIHFTVLHKFLSDLDFSEILNKTNLGYSLIKSTLQCTS